MKFFRRKRPIGRLSLDEGAELLFYGETELPPPQPILEFLQTVPPSPVRWRLPVNYVLRGEAHLKGWLEAFLRVEREDLNRRFNNADKSFECWVLVDRLASAVDIKIRLKTTGVGGYTQYVISIVKIEDDEFLCVE